MDKTNSKFEILEGKFTMPLTYREGKEGKFSFACFCLLKPSGTLQTCKVFGDIADTMYKKKLKGGERLCLRGRILSDNYESNFFNANQIAYPDEEAKAAIAAKLHRTKGDIKADKIYWADMANKGFVPIVDDDGHKKPWAKKDCVVIEDGEFPYIPKIYFAMNVLGGKWVTERMREAKFGLGISKADVPRWESFKDELVSIAQQMLAAKRLET